MRDPGNMERRTDTKPPGKRAAFSSRYKQQRRWLIAAAVVTVAALVVTGCASNGGDKATGASSSSGTAPESSPAQKTTTPSPTSSKKSKKPASEIDAKAMEKAFRANLGGKPIKSMCDSKITHWACFYDGVEAGPSYLRVILTTDGGRTDADEMAKDAGRHWFNFIGCDFPKLTTIAVRINGIDHNVFRADTNADLIRC